jgi:guanidinopropionase
MPADPRFQPVDAAIVPRFADVATFMRTKRHDVHPDVDIGLVGVSFDLGVNYRTGARQGPAGVREASRLIRRVHPTLGTRPFDIRNVADLGDAPVNPLDKMASIQSIQAFFEDLRENAIIPISVGGDHTIPTPILRGLVTDEPVGILQIDSHPDTLAELCGDTVNHATFMRLGINEGWIDPKRVVQLGLRGSRFGDDIQYGLTQGFTVITIEDYEELGRAETIRRIHAALGDAPFYLTLDIDGVDPAYCPGTAVPEIGGLIPRDLQVIIRSLAGKPIIGADISEVAPCFDPTGITCVTAANLMFEMLCVVAERRRSA